MTILLSIESKYVKKILNKTKKYEFRGWKLPEKIKFIYIYSSKIEKKIVARFEVKKIYKDSPSNIWNMLKDDSDISEREYFDYVNRVNYKFIYAIKIDSLLSFNTPVSLLDVDKNLYPPQKFTYLNIEQIQILEGYLNK